MTLASHKPTAQLKPIKGAPAFHSAIMKKAAQVKKTGKPWRMFKREIGQLPGRQRAGYANQLDAMDEIAMLLLWTANLATGYAHVCLMQLASETNTGTTSDAGNKGYGRTWRALRRLRELGYISFTRALLHPHKGGRDRIMVTVNPKLFTLYGQSEAGILERTRKALNVLISKSKKQAESGYGLPISALDALAQPTTAARLLGLWQWYKYTKTDFRRFYLAVRRAGLPIVEPVAQPHPAFDSPPLW